MFSIGSRPMSAFGISQTIPLICSKSASGLIAVMSAAAHYVGALSLYMFAAVTSVNGQLNNLDYMRAFDCSEAVAVFIYLAAILSGLTAWRYSGYYEKSFDR